jgi:hypothetical protein
MRISRLRAAQRTVAGLVGDELVDRFHEFNDTVLYNFSWEVNGTTDNVLVPRVSLTMETGKGPDNPATSSLSQRAALGLWDEVASSIRVWPPGTAKPGAFTSSPARRAPGA